MVYLSRLWRLTYFTYRRILLHNDSNSADEAFYNRAKEYHLGEPKCQRDNPAWMPSHRRWKGPSDNSLCHFASGIGRASRWWPCPPASSRAAGAEAGVVWATFTCRPTTRAEKPWAGILYC